MMEIEVETNWYPKDIRDDLNKIAAYEQENGDAGSLIDYIVSHDVKVEKVGDDKGKVKWKIDPHEKMDSEDKDIFKRIIQSD